MSFTDEIKFTKVIEKSQQRVAMAFVMSMMALSTLIFGYLIFEPTPLAYENVPFKVINRRVKPGSVVTYEVRRCNSTNQVLEYSVTQGLRSIEGNYVIDLGETKIIAEPGCNYSISQITVIPKTLAPGRYQVIGLAKVDGTVREHIVRWESVEFTVIN